MLVPEMFQSEMELFSLLKVLMPVSPDPSPENAVAVTVPATSSAVVGAAVPMPTLLLVLSMNMLPPKLKLPGAEKLPEERLLGEIWPTPLLNRYVPPICATGLPAEMLML